MTDSPSGERHTSMTTSSAPARGWFVLTAIAAVGFVVGAIAGAYLNWFWWEIGSRPLVTILAVAVVVVGCVMSVIRDVIARRIALFMLAVGFGLLAGQNLGPVREPLISQPGGTMTLLLEWPVVAKMTGSADCTNVASESEFVVSAQPERPVGQLGMPDGILLQSGDRWAYPRDTGRKDRVRLQIGVTTQLVPGSIKMLDRIEMEATEASNLESTFSNEGGSLHFADLVAMSEPGDTVESMDLAGTLEWTCGAALP